MREVMYRDDAVLDSFVAQADGLVLSGVTTKAERSGETSATAKPNFNFGSILEKVGLPNLSIGIDIAKRRSRVAGEAASYTLPQEEKYRYIAQKLSDGKKLYRDKYEAWCAARANTGNVFCEIEGEFIPAGWQPQSDAWREFANAQRTLVLHAKEEETFLMGMSLSKIVGISDGQIGVVSHLAMRTRNGGLAIRVFGSMDKTKYIKPFFAAYL
ncbi:hypothetical protein [uncultured Magnetospirillum sp.]|nr:hypothetical protein [uncultured Magnetospirillum sp.]